MQTTLNFIAILISSLPLEALNSIRSCISDIRTWMVHNKLKINDDKTEFLIITSPRAKFLHEINLSIGQEIIPPSSSCKSLGVTIDEHIMMDTYIQNICRAAHFHLRNIRLIRDLIPEKSAAQLVHSLVSSRIDYCNSLLYGVPEYKTDRLQRVHNIAARIVTRSNPDHITPVLKELHWLRIKFRVRFKILLLTYKCLNNLAPEYLTDLVVPRCSERPKRQSTLSKLKLPVSRLKSYGDRSFSFAAPKEWNDLPLTIKLAPTVSTFKSKLKTHLFNECFKNT